MRRIAAAVLVAGVAFSMSAISGLAYGVSVAALSPIAPGATVTVHATSWDAPGAPVSFFVTPTDDPNPPAASFAHTKTTVTSTFDETFAMPKPLADGTYWIVACEPAAGPPDPTHPCSGSFTGTTSTSIQVRNPKIDSIVTQPALPGATVTASSSKWIDGATVSFFWNHNLGTAIQTVTADGSGNANGVTLSIPQPLADGTYEVEACLANATPAHLCLAGPDPVAIFVAVKNLVLPSPTTAPTTKPSPKPTVKAAVSPSPSPSPSASPSPSPVVALALPSPEAPAAQPSVSSGEVPATVIRAQAAKSVNLLVAGFSLLAVAGTAGFAAGGLTGVTAVGGASHGPPSGGGAGKSAKLSSAKVKFMKDGRPALALGDRSRTWRWPGTDSADRLSIWLPQLLLPRSPMLARVAVDGTYLRAIYGIGYAVFPVAGVVLGALALADVGGMARPPSLAITAAILILGVLDATSGLVAFAVFAGGVAIAGGLVSAPALRTMMGMAALFFVTPLIAGAVRPLRRHPSENFGQLWDRGADFVVASLIGAWAVQKLVLSLPLLAGQHLALTQSANLCGLAVALALAGRLGAESIAANIYPQRLISTQPHLEMRTSVRQRLIASLGRTGIFVFVALPFVGPRWQLWVGAFLFLLPQLLKVFEQRYPNAPRLYRVIPRGLLKTVVVLFVAKWLATIAMSAPDPSEIVADAYVLTAVPGATLALLGLIGREGADPPLDWLHRAAGAAVFAVGVLFALGYIG